MKKKLPIVDCSGCGACCMTIGTPPGYAMVVVPLLRGKLPTGSAEDIERYHAMPDDPRRELTDYYRSLIEAGWPREQDRSAHEVPCLWYDAETRQCRHHDARPQICRDFPVGGTACRRMRAEIVAN